jgi:hypothetical protein
MKKTLSTIILVLVSGLMLFGQTLDPAYTQKFGYGIILASAKGFPVFTKYDETQFNFKEGKFFLEPGEASTIDLRAILPQGTTMGSYMTKLKAERGNNLSHKTNEFYVWEIWCSHDGDVDQVTGNYTWPASAKDIPAWGSPCAEVYQTYTAEVSSWASTGLTWDYNGGNLQFQFGTYLHMAKPGYKYYITLRMAYEYSVPGGQNESKWNSVLNRFENVVSEGGVGYVYSDPIASCTVEIAGFENQTGRFQNNGDGTVTDTKSGLTWIQAPIEKTMSYEDAQQYADNFEFAGSSSWRLPSFAELEGMMKCSMAMDVKYEFTWLNSNGFSNVQAATYWSSDDALRDGQPIGEKMTVDFLYKITGSDDMLRMYNVWLVK